MLGGVSEEGDKLFNVRLYEPLLALLLMFWIPRVVATKRLGVPRPLQVMLGLLVGVGLLALRIAPDRLLALKVGVRTFFEPLSLFVVITSLSWKRSDLRRVLFAFLCVALLSGGASLFGHLTRGGGASSAKASSVKASSAKELDRLRSSWEGTNVQAAFLGAAVPIALGVLLSRSSRTLVITGLSALVTGCVVLILTYTRGVWIAVGVASLFMVSVLRAWVWAALVGLLLFAGLAAGPPQFLHRMESIIRFEEQRSAMNRLVLWPKIAQLIAEKPVTGYGFGAFKVLLSRRSEINSVHAHNVLLDVAMTIGIPGLALFLGIVAYVFGRAWLALRSWRRPEDCIVLLGLVAGGLSLLTAGLTDGSVSVWPVLAHTFWFVLALTHVVAVTSEEENSTPRVKPFLTAAATR